MPGDPFYRSATWRRLCATVARRSGGKCEAPGCSRLARIVDHIVSRRRGGRDELANLRHLCPSCDNKVKEDAGGDRRNGGVLGGCDAGGVPLDPAHPWHGQNNEMRCFETSTNGVALSGGAEAGAGSLIGAQRGRDRPGARASSKFRGRR